MFFVVFLPAVVFVSIPRHSDAGFLSAITKFFSGSSQTSIQTRFQNLVPESHAAYDDPAVTAENRPPDTSTDTEDISMINVVQESALVAPLNPIGIVPASGGPASGQIISYTVRQGDTIGTIAKSFDVSQNTIRWANNIPVGKALTVGQQLIILPVTGVSHEVKKGDTIASIAKKYQANIDDIIQFNGLAPDEEPAVGSIVIVPDGESQQVIPVTPNAPRVRYFANLPVYDGFYIRPIIGGRKTQGIHGYNGVDLATSCGEPILASAQGTALIARTNGWNGGYGRYVVISHQNSTQTLYAHMRDVSVVPGQIIQQGEVIGKVGSSGNSTGCHVHFEIRGAQNPF